MRTLCTSADRASVGTPATLPAGAEAMRPAEIALCLDDQGATCSLVSMKPKVPVEMRPSPRRRRSFRLEGAAARASPRQALCPGASAMLRDRLSPSEPSIGWRSRRLLPASLEHLARIARTIASMSYVGFEPGCGLATRQSSGSGAVGAAAGAHKGRPSRAVAASDARRSERRGG
jgi:hypothetical protein